MQLRKTMGFVNRMAKKLGAIDDTEESITEVETLQLPDTFQES